MSNVIDYQPAAPKPVTPRWMLWTGRVLSMLPILMMGVGGIVMLFMPEMIQKGLDEQGWPANLAYVILALEIGSALLYAIPQTAVLGAILLTGYLGGAIATHLRMADYPGTVPAIVIGIIVWLGLYFRDARVRSLIPLRRL